MPLHCLILLFLRQTTVESWSSLAPATAMAADITATPATTSPEGMLRLLQLEAVPDYPVAAGQRVDLHCPSFNTTFSVTWSWQRLQNETWTVVASGQDLTLTKPEQSGRYRCLARWGLSQERESTQHAVLIVSMPARADEALGIAALVFSLLAFIFSLATPLWLCLQKRGFSLNTVLKDFPRAQSSPEGDLPKRDCEGDVYMNYEDSNPAYSDLDPSNLSVDNVYSSLS
ncbi:uncharacterized protein LOC142883266 [Nelusetta ayraudi]|uniref:uncharacterized protein LOC142883266 n=1 Tax=Nelusetta ayraudi TaxID=303726 RepID=UPI003F71AA81